MFGEAFSMLAWNFSAGLRERRTAQDLSAGDAESDLVGVAKGLRYCLSSALIH